MGASQTDGPCLKYCPNYRHVQAESKVEVRLLGDRCHLASALWSNFSDMPVG